MVPKRALADIAELQQPLYANQGIFYVADDTTALEGYGCVLGPPGTPYEDCPMLYRFVIPSDFPFTNPKLTFLTSDGQTRFHPNMYVEGKCCLSILGTWEGPRWASTMRLSTVLVTLQSLLDNNPLLHEPGYNPKDEHTKDFYEAYCQKIEWECIQVILRCAMGTYHSSAFEPFTAIYAERLPGILDRLEARLTSRVQGGDANLTNLPYRMRPTQTRYQEALQRVQALRKKIESLKPADQE